jgi:hypothetical protein
LVQPVRRRRKSVGTYDKVNFEVGLPPRAERVNATIALLLGDVLLAGHEIVVDTGETNQLEETAAEGSGPLVSVGGHGGVVGQSGAQKVVVESKAVFEAENMRKEVWDGRGGSCRRVARWRRT